MPNGQIVIAGQTITQPGTYGRIQTNVVTVIPDAGIPALVGRSSFGTLGASGGLVDITSYQHGVEEFGVEAASTNTLTEMIRQAFLAGVTSVKAYRLGTGGTKAKRVLVDTDGSPANIGNWEAVDVGIRTSWTTTIRAKPGDATKKEAIVYDANAAIKQTTEFAADATDEALALQTASASAPYVRFTKTAIGNGVMALITQQPFTTAGVDPTVANGDYTTAQTALSADEDWDVLAVESESTTIQAVVKAYIEAEILAGRRRQAVVGEPTSVGESTRRTNATALNDPALVYVANGYTDLDSAGAARTNEGFKAAAFVAGLVAGMRPGHTLTWRSVPGATAIVGTVNKDAAIAAGMLYFESVRGRVRTGYGINTLVNEDAPPQWAETLGVLWNRAEYVRTAFDLLGDIYAVWDDVLSGPVDQRPPNSAGGRLFLAARATRVVDDYIRNPLQPVMSGSVIEDPGTPPSTDEAWFAFDNLVIGLRVAKLGLRAVFTQ